MFRIHDVLDDMNPHRVAKPQFEEHVIYVPAQCKQAFLQGSIGRVASGFVF